MRNVAAQKALLNNTVFLSYLSDATLFAPGRSCHGQPTRYPLPYPTMGASAQFFGGQAVVCGGARERYFGCADLEGGARECQGGSHNAALGTGKILHLFNFAGNVQCVETLGGSQWCSGPKTDVCLVYDKELTRHW